MILKKLSQKVLKLRKRLGILQGDLAKAARINQALICQIENGKTIDMGADAFHRLARTLGVTMEFLLDDEELLPPRKQDQIVAGRSKPSGKNSSQQPQAGMTLGRKIKNLRLDQGMKSSELAIDAGITPSGLSQVETMKRQPKGSTLWRIAKALGVKVDYLVDEERPYPPRQEDAFRKAM